MELFLTRLWGHFPNPTVPFTAGLAFDEQGQRHLALVVAYQGSKWAGWQYQASLPTIQNALELVLSRLCDHEVRIHASGRTDAGVHAFGQVASFSTTSRMPADKMLAAMRSMLAPGIFPIALGPVTPEFHARYSALAKTYDYYIAPAVPTAAFLEPFVWPLPHDLNEAAMRQALMFFIGSQDLRALATGHNESAMRNILEANLSAKPGLWRIRLTAQGFLRHVVRNLVGILVHIGSGKLRPGQLGEMIRAGEKLYSAPKAPANGLYLQKVYYHPWPGPAAD